MTMKNLAIALSLLLAAPAFAGGPGPEEPKNACYQKTITVCPLKKPKPKPVVKKEEVKPAPEVKVVEKIVEVEKIVYVEKVVEAPAPAPKPADAPVSPKGPTFGVGGRAAVATMYEAAPHVFGLVGVRGRWFPARLGVEVNTQFYWGHQVQLMVYPVQGKFSWHLDAGALWFYHNSLATQDVPRKWDLTVGTGIEWNFLKHVSLTADLRTAIPNPWVMAKYAPVDANGRYLNVGNTIGNSFLGTQLQVGLMFHTW